MHVSDPAAHPSVAPQESAAAAAAGTRPSVPRGPPPPAADASGPRRGAGLVLLGLLALGRAACADGGPVSAAEAGRPLDLAVENLQGERFRLLPGVGPALAARLEAARVAAGGRLDPARLEEVPGVGPVLAARWRALGAAPSP